MKVDTFVTLKDNAAILLRVHLVNNISTKNNIRKRSTQWNCFWCPKTYYYVSDAYTSVPLLHLGRSDHTLNSLLPRYRLFVQREPPITRTKCRWTNEARDALKGSLYCTDWSVFTNTRSDGNELTNTVCGYNNFCIYGIVPTTKLHIYPKNSLPAIPYIVVSILIFLQSLRFL